MTQATEDLEQDIAQTRTRLGDTIDRLQGSLSPSDVFDDLIGRRVEDGRGGLGHAATLRFPSPLIKPDVRISRIRLSDWFQPAAHGGTPSSVCVAEAVGDGRRAQQHRSASVFAAG